MSAGSLAWVARKARSQLVVSAGARGAILHVPSALLDRAMPFSPFAGQIREATRQTQVHGPLDAETLSALEVSFGSVTTEAAGRHPGADEIVEAHVRILTIILWRLLRQLAPEKATQLPGELVQRFLAELDLRLRDQPSVPELAEALGVTTDKLTRAVRRTLGRTPKQVIHLHLMAAAEKLLVETSLQVDQVSALLGFTDPSYFNRFFSRRAGTPPARYRRTRPKSEDDLVLPTFAAWP